MAQLIPLPLTVSCFSKIQIGFAFWYRLTWVVPEKGPLNGCVCVSVSLISPSLNGHQTEFAHSMCGHTIALQSNIQVCASIQTKVLLIIPSTLLYYFFLNVILNVRLLSK